MSKATIYGEAILAVISGQNAPARLDEDELLDVLDELFRQRLAHLNDREATNG